MAPADHSIRHDCRQQRLDRGEQRDRERRAGERWMMGARDAGSRAWADLRGSRQTARDGFDRQVQELREQRSHDQRDKRPGYASNPRPHDDDGKGGNRDDQCPGFTESNAWTYAPISAETRRDRLHLETEQIADLAREDDQRDAAGEPDRHRVGNELDRAAEPE